MDLYSLAVPVAKHFATITEDMLKVALSNYDVKLGRRSINIRSAKIVGKDVAIFAKVGDSCFAFVTQVDSIGKRG